MQSPPYYLRLSSTYLPTYMYLPMTDPYLPTYLSTYLPKQNPVENLVGSIESFYGHSLLPQSLYESFKDNCKVDDPDTFNTQVGR